MDSRARIPAVRAAKAALRAEIREKLAGLTERRRCDEGICSRLLDAMNGRSVDFVIGYLALPDEARIDDFLSLASIRNLPVLLPRVRANRLNFGQWREGISLSRDEKGVLAPVDALVDETPRGCGLVVVPGRAFDELGRRLGRGGGYYDRLLADLPDALSIGVAYETQLVGEVPVETHDRTVAMIVTEKRTLVVPTSATVAAR